MSGSGIQVYSGQVFDPLNPDPVQLDIGDIAHALSLQCRFNGHTRTFYSVAQHSALVAFHCSSEHALTGLLHDAAEAYLGDLASPLKASGFGAEYKAVERQLMFAVATRFNTDFPDPEEVREIDLRMLATERRDLLPSTPEGDELWAPWLTGVKPYPDEVVGMPPLGAELTFLKMFELLGGVQ